jgi:rare lipoprotein A
VTPGAAPRRSRFLFLVPMLGVAACAPAPVPVAAPPEPAAAPPPPVAEQPTFTETGLASWYGTAHQGQRTASGERFDQQALTAAHPTLPLGTIARITSVEHGTTVKVRINDRGPRTRGRILDLSAAAANALALRHDGVARIRLEVFASDQRGG